MVYLMPYVPLLALLAWAASQDLRHRRIRNWLTLVMILSGFTQSLIVGATVTPWESFCGMGAGLGLTFILFAINALGGGDVKLMTGVGAWLGPLGVFEIFAAAAVIGMGIVLLQCARSGRLKVLFRNAAMVFLNLKHWEIVGVGHLTQTGLSCRSVEKPLPYAVPVFTAVVALIFMMGMK